MSLHTLIKASRLLSKHSKANTITSMTILVKHITWNRLHSMSGSRPSQVRLPSKSHQFLYTTKGMIFNQHRSMVLPKRTQTSTRLLSFISRVGKLSDQNRHAKAPSSMILVKLPKLATRFHLVDNSRGKPKTELAPLMASPTPLVTR